MDGRSIAGLQWNEGDDWEARAAHGARAGCRTAKGCGNGGNVRKRGAGTRGVDAVRAEPYGRAVRGGPGVLAPGKTGCGGPVRHDPVPGSCRAYVRCGEPTGTGRLRHQAGPVRVGSTLTPR
ncbi:hypothetical protein GCM10010493_02080 [Streptomyces lavendulae subsp. grasserius]